jgi:small multidrug resistance family-3 protein
VTVQASLLVLVLAATLEIAGDAALRRGLAASAWSWLALGAATLVAYGFAVNLNRRVEFGRLMGVYIAVFFVVSQVLSFAFFGERPTLRLVVGGLMIVGGGLVIQGAGR